MAITRGLSKSAINSFTDIEVQKIVRVKDSKVTKNKAGQKKKNRDIIDTKDNKEKKSVKSKKTQQNSPKSSKHVLQNSPLIIDGVSSDVLFENALKIFSKSDPKIIELIGKCPKPKFLFAGSTERSAFESLAKSIVSQQLSRSSAQSIYTRFKIKFGIPLEDVKKESLGKKDSNEREIFLNQNEMDFFITPESILSHEPEDLKTVGLSFRKAEYIISLANYFKSNNLKDDDFHPMTNDEISERLVKIKGIGQWTIDMFLMFYLNRLDVIPTLDLEIKKAMCRHFNISFTKKSPTHQELVELSTRWIPYRSIASWYMWSMRDHA
ncbi:putative DNA-3-methyladenine glycosylase YfjP [Smittium mucronatum]|uniref:Putative DNA-3-methyladenine glycosylase YfjP n=1 Tax=Smittium mucronatum TaxID=133383 RepID=A0A1R0H6T4_9FUNG|nr:putative DNA-3-methyladenine glycosylase YfjP [Smittium mucronatum]